MRSPSTKQLYGFVSTFGTSVNVTQDEIAAWDAELEAEARAERQDRASSSSLVNLTKSSFLNIAPKAGAK